MDAQQSIESRLEKIESLLLQKKNVLNFDEVAAYTGLSKSYLYKLTSLGSIPHYKPNGKNIFFQREEIENWLLSNRIMTNAEAEKAAINIVTINKKGR